MSMNKNQEDYSVSLPYFVKKSASNGKDVSKDNTGTYDRYTLVSIAKNNMSMTDIYLHFFPSIYKKNVSPETESIITRKLIS